MTVGLAVARLDRRVKKEAKHALGEGFLALRKVKMPAEDKKALETGLALLWSALIITIGLAQHALATPASRALAAYVAVAVPLGLWMGWTRGAFRTLNPLIQMLRPISPIAWIPIAILWFGVGNASPIYLIFISSVFPMVVQTIAGVHTIERRYLRAAANFGVSRYTLFGQVTKGMDVVDQIVNAPRDSRDLPHEPIAMKSVTISED